MPTRHRHSDSMTPGFPRRWLCTWLCWVGCALSAWTAEPPPSPLATVLSTVGSVEVARSGADTWDPARREQALFAGDQLRTGERSRATVRLQDGSIIHYDELTQVRFGTQPNRTILEVLRGLLSFFHRDQPASAEVRGGGVSALIRGTEFTFRHDPDGRVELTLLDGEVQFANAAGTLELHRLERAVARPGEAPQRTALLASQAVEAIQWLLYYPAVLDPEELPWTAPERAPVQSSLDAYRAGDLLAALRAYPLSRVPASPSEQVFLAALLLSVGNVADATRELKAVPGDVSGLAGPRRALAELIDTVRARTVQTGSFPTEASPGTASEWLARSYACQARRDLVAALQAAREAAVLQPEFGFGWARVAELEFGFGRLRDATRALNRALDLAPRHAQALALRGFLAAAAFRPTEALIDFDAALQLDPGLGNAWLGRGLVRWRQGDTAAGRADLMMAVAAEPDRGVLRSYLGKAFTDQGDRGRAEQELALARERDPLDPTAWLYAALLHQQENRLNDAVRDLARAESLREQRAVYRSALLLDQDQAVQGARRAQLYREIGLEPLAVREAGRALAFDAANPAAHQFLAESYANVERINLRYEAPRVSEYLQANLLAPVGAGTLAPQLSQQEYSRLFEQDGLHGFSATRYRSSGAWEQSGGLFGTVGRLGFLADGYYARGEGVAANTDFEQSAFEAQTKVQASARDTFYLQTLVSQLEAGDLATYADPEQRDPDLRQEESLRPVFVLGWHRAWSPEHHSLVLGTWIESTQDLDDPRHLGLLSVLDDAGRVAALYATPEARWEYHSESRWLTLEAQHLWQTEANTLIVGARYAAGQIEADSRLTGLAPFTFPERSTLDHPADRTQVYAYDTWRPIETLAFTAGVSADTLAAPENFRAGPLVDETRRVARVLPKAGVVWQPRTNLWLRGAYSQGLGGIGFEQSFRLEPTPLAGFNQLYRSLLSESVVGALTAERQQIGLLALETRWGPDTFLGVEGEWQDASADRPQGVFALGGGGNPGVGTFSTATLGQKLDQTERAVSAYVHRLLDRDWTLSLRYRVAWMDVDEFWPDLPAGVAVDPQTRWQRQAETSFTTQEVQLGVRYNHPSGWYAGADAGWTFQTSTGTRALETESAFRSDLFVGRRFWQRRAAIQLGLENLTGDDYRLSPWTLVAEPPRERTLVVQFRITY